MTSVRRIESQREQWPHRIAALRWADSSQGTTFTDSTSTSGAETALAAGTAEGIGGLGNWTATGIAQNAAGNKYEYGGAGPGSTNAKGQPAHSWDCSGLVGDELAAFTNKPTGGAALSDPNGKRFNTTTDMKSMGLEPGYVKGEFNVGVNPNPGTSGHIVSELPNGEHSESSGSGGVQYGDGAKSVFNPEFTQQWHLPGSGDAKASDVTAVGDAMKTSHRRQAVPKNPSRQELHKIMEAIEDSDWEGITLNKRPGDGPTSGYMVSPPNRERSHPIDELSGEKLQEYFADSPPEANYGGWRENDDDGDLWYHDNPVNIQDSYDAARAAVDWKQKAVFDNDKRDAHGKALPSAYIYTGPFANSGPASALGWTHANRRRRTQ